MIEEYIVKELLLSGIAFYYESYNHQAALREMNTFSANNSLQNQYQVNCWGIPDEIKKNNLIWRNGRVKEILLDRKGNLLKVKIGTHYFKNFYPQDFGVKVKPKLFKSDDKYELISKGLAVEECI